MDTIVFFFALLFSLFGGSVIIVSIINSRFAEELNKVFFIMLVISLLWTWFYWLVN